MTTEHQSPSGRETLRIIDVPAVDLANVLTNTAPDQVVAVPGVKVGDIVYVTPLGVWPAGLVMLPHRVLTEGQVSVRVGNVEAAGGRDPVAQTLRFGVFRRIRTGADRNSPSGRTQKLTSDVTVDFGSVSLRAAVDVDVLVPGALPGDTIIVTPMGVFPDGLVLGGPHRCEVAGTVITRIGNVTDGSLDPPVGIYRYTLYRNVLHPDRQSPSGRVQRRDFDLPYDAIAVGAHDTEISLFQLPGASLGDAYIVTPLGVFDAGLVMGPHTCPVANILAVRIGNVTAGLITPVAQTYRVSLIRR